ncbi:MAG: phenylacetic acid degradation bifunctional protein PaaZ [Granulosicoccus sp.]
MKQIKLQSYLSGHWVYGDREGSPLKDASTGEVVALIDATGHDLPSALEFGRSVGGPALRSMSLHGRALMLKSLGLALMEAKEEFYALSTATGATRSDSWVDIEGGIGTLLTYASRARRELPNASIWLDGPTESLSRDDTFSAQHVLNPLTGIAIHINAFNFPCWGMLEKLAPTLLAGMPAIIKPASQTAYLTECMVRRMIDTQLLPPGALQVVCGSVGDMLDHVTPQDVVTFTGSAVTGQSLKTTPAIVNNAVRFTMEADSLNSAILGSDAIPGTPEFDLFVNEVVNEMTAKAGQKCTAIRRVMVPRKQIQVFSDALLNRLSGITIGLASDPDVAMGPLASFAQRTDVSDSINSLAQEAELLTGDPQVIDLVSGDSGRGAFVSPAVLYCDKPSTAQSIHSVEAFGPVCTIMPYDSVDNAMDLVKRGQGSLVASLFTNDAELAQNAVASLGPWHGRIMLGNRRSQKTSTGHGAPLPVLVHGGPGRAGGGEELGGMRAVKHYMQRTAVQGTPALLSKVVGRWMPGGDTRTNVHPFRHSLLNLELGDQFVSAERVITLDDIEHFAGFTGDKFYAHMNEEQARANPFFEGRVAHGYLIVSFAAGMFVDPAPGPVLANYGVDNLRFFAPVYAGDSLQVSLTCKQINPRELEAYGEVRWDSTIVNQQGSVVAQYDVLTMVAKT